MWAAVTLRTAHKEMSSCCCMLELSCLLWGYHDAWMSLRSTSSEVIIPLYWCQTDYVGLILFSKGFKYGLTCVGPITDLMRAFPSKRDNQKATIKGLIQLSAMYDTPQVTDDGQGAHFTGHVIQQWAQDQDLWIFHLPCDPTGAGLIEDWMASWSEPWGPRVTLCRGGLLIYMVYEGQ